MDVQRRCTGRGWHPVPRRRTGGRTRARAPARRCSRPTGRRTRRSGPCRSGRPTTRQGGERFCPRPPPRPVPGRCRARADRGAGRPPGRRYPPRPFRLHHRSATSHASPHLIRQLPIGKLLRFAALKANSLWASPYADPAKIRAEGPTDESLRVVARVYRMAIAAREIPPRPSRVASNSPGPTAARWVKTARKRGFLGPTDERRPGERKRR